MASRPTTRGPRPGANDRQGGKGASHQSERAGDVSARRWSPAGTHAAPLRSARARTNRSVVVTAPPVPTPGRCRHGHLRPHLLFGDKDASSRHHHIAPPRCRCVHLRPLRSKATTLPEPSLASSAAGRCRRDACCTAARSAPLRSGPAGSPLPSALGALRAGAWRLARSPLLSKRSTGTALSATSVRSPLARRYSGIAQRTKTLASVV
jgi:hypothetical protein